MFRTNPDPLFVAASLAVPPLAPAVTTGRDSAGAATTVKIMMLKSLRKDCVVPRVCRDGPNVAVEGRASPAPFAGMTILSKSRGEFWTVEDVLIDSERLPTDFHAADWAAQGCGVRREKRLTLAKARGGYDRHDGGCERA
jgi:hypothetical protein